MKSRRTRPRYLFESHMTAAAMAMVSQPVSIIATGPVKIGHVGS